MAQSTGPIIAIGAITVANEVVFNNQPMNWRVPIATGIAAIAFAGAEAIIGPTLPRGIALLALVTVVFARTNPNIKAPAESALDWWNGAK